MKLPAIIGGYVEVKSERGIVLKVKKHGIGVYSAMIGDNPPHSRWGSSGQIRQDIEHFKMTDTLPHGEKNW